MRSLAGASFERTLRICLITEIFHPEDQGGQGRQAFDLARGILARDVSVTVVTRRSFKDTPRRETLDGIAVERLPPGGMLKGKGWAAAMPTTWFLLGLFAHLLSTRRHYDLLLVHAVKGILVPALLVSWLCGKPCIIRIDALADVEQDLTPESLAKMGWSDRNLMVRMWSRLRTALLQRADAVVAISSEIAAALAKRMGSSRRVVHIPNGIDLKHWSSSSGSKEELRRRLGLPQGVLITYTGRLSRAKGLVMLLEAWEQLAPRYPDTQLVLIGSGDRSFDGCEAQLQDQARRGGIESRVTFTGQVDEVREYLCASDLFVLCSDSEGFALSLIEAMAVGLPCISTTVGVAPDVLRHRLSGWLIPVRDAQALHAVLAEALDDPASWPAMGAAAQRAVTARFDLQEVAARYVKLFESLLPQNSAARVQGG